MQTNNHEIYILLAEDDVNLGNFLKTYLNNKGFKTDLFTNGEEAYKAFLTSSYNFCITDVMMPIKDGFTLAKDIRKSNAHIPILFLTAKTLEEDRLKGFQIGADDYITKPFSMDELTLRIQAIIRRSQTPTKEVIEKKFHLGKCLFDYNQQGLIDAQGEKHGLTSKESDLLLILCENENEVVTRSDALNRVWHNDNYFNARSMDVYIAKLRKILKTSNANVEILNVHGVGFKLITK